MAPEQSHAAHAPGPSGPGDAVFVQRHAAGKAHGQRARVTHAYAALAFCTGGRMESEQRGRFRVERGDVLLVPAGVPHRTLSAERVESWGVGFTAASFTAADAAVLLAPFDRVRAGGSAVVRVPEARHVFLESLLAELRDATGDARDQGGVRSLLTLVVREVARATAWPAEATQEAPRDVVGASLAVIERRCLSRLTLGEIAAAVGRSPSYVTTALRRETGRSAVAWITEGRMAEARRLLLHSSETVDAIGARIGYADTTHFVRTFRRGHGATPAAWRNARRDPAS